MMKFVLSGAKRLVTGISGARLRPVFELWVRRYSAQIRREFVVNSRGGGAWPDLSEYTKRMRARKAAAKKQVVNGEGGKKKIVKASGTRRFAILRDTGLLLNALTIGASGNLIKYTDDSVTFGLAKVKHGDDRVTIQDIAAYHNEGGKRLPKRQILNEPTSQTREAMMSDLRRLINGLGGSSGH